MTPLSSLDRIGYITWGITCLIGGMYLRVVIGPGPYTTPYSLYLFAQSGLALSRFLELETSSILTMIIAACAYFCLSSQYFIGKAFPRGVVVVWAVATLCAGLEFSVLPLGVAARDGMKIVQVVYGPAALSVFAVIVNAASFYRTPDGKFVRCLLVGVLGGIFGLLDLYWPKFVWGGTQFTLLSRLADSTLYVPLVIPALVWLDGQKDVVLAGSRKLRALVIASIGIAILAAAVQQV